MSQIFYDGCLEPMEFGQNTDLSICIRQVSVRYQRYNEKTIYLHVLKSRFLIRKIYGFAKIIAYFLCSSLVTGSKDKHRVGFLFERADYGKTFEGLGAQRSDEMR